MNDIFDDVVHQMATTKIPVYIEAAAGCGKTEAIAKAVAQAEGRQLVLTHTHAGIAVLRSRLSKYNIPNSKYRIATIASWLLKYVLAYPSMSEFTNPRPSSREWSQVYPAAQKLFGYPFVKDVLCASYDGVFIDEYQDCTKSQHKIIQKISESLPVCVLGDPLQKIFDFNQDPAVNWENDVIKSFASLPPLKNPYRWLKDGNNQELGEQIAEIRESLEVNKPVDLRNYSQISWEQWSNEREAKVLLNFNRSGAVAGIHSGQRNQDGEHFDRISGKKAGGQYQCIEEMDCYALQSEAREFDRNLGKNLFQMRHRLKCFIQQGITEQSEQTALQEVNSEIDKLDMDNFISSIPTIINLALQKLPIYRKELFQEMKKSAQEFCTGKYEKFSEASYAVRDKTRVNGRRVTENRIISRTLLIKGLEFDHVIVLNVDHIQNGTNPMQNFYVAITRGAKSLTVLSTSPIFK